MKKIALFLVIVSLLGASSSLRAAQDDWSLNQRFTLYGDYLYMKRMTLDNKKIVEGVGKRLGTKRTLDRFGFESGYRVGLFWHAGCENSFEGAYTHMGEWVGDSHIRGNGNLYVPFTSLNLSSDYYNASLAREEYTSEYASGDLTWWHHFTERRVNYFSFSSLLGLRAITLDETFQLSMTRQSNKSTYKIDATNRLYGAQVGFNFQWNPTDNLSWDLMARAGGFYNDLDTSTNARDLNNTTTLGKYSRSGSNTAFLGETALTLSYQMGCYFNIHVGYQFLYLTGVSLAPKQFSLTNNTPGLRRRLSKNGEAVIHGAIVGINLGF